MPRKSGVIANLTAIWQSFRSLPLWVQVWVGLILFPANMASLLMLQTWAGVVAAWAFLFVCATNLPIMYIERGLGRLMAIPHLIAWIPLQVALALRLSGEVGGTAPVGLELGFIWMLLVINGISLAFDLVDTVRWFRGEREVSGRI